MGKIQIYIFFGLSWYFLIFGYLKFHFFKRNSFWDRAKKGDSVLDLCCGSGDLAFLLSEKVGSSGKVCSLLFVIQLMLPKFGAFSMNLS